MVTIKAYKAGMQEAKDTLQQTSGDKIEALNILHKKLRKAGSTERMDGYEHMQHSIEALRNLILQEYAEGKGYTYDNIKGLWIRKE